MLNLTSSLAGFHAPALSEYRKRLHARLDEGESPAGIGEPPVLASVLGLTLFDTERLAAYVRSISDLAGTSSRRGEGQSAGFAEGFPGAHAARGDVLPMRYSAGGRDYLMVLLKEQGRWKVLEPALPM